MFKKGQFGSDPMDAYSASLGVEPTPKGLGLIITFPVRALPEKPGRSLVVLHDDRFPDFPVFNPTYSYINILWRVANSAGSHYHLLKREVFTAVVGGFIVYLRASDGKIVEKVVLKAPEEGESIIKRLYIPETVVHKVEALHSPSVLHVLASSPNTKSDEFSVDL